MIYAKNPLPTIQASKKLGAGSPRELYHVLPTCFCPDPFITPEGYEKNGTVWPLRDVSFGRRVSGSKSWGLGFLGLGLRV